MEAKPEYRDRDETDVEVLDALADRHEDGMTVFELRAKVEEDIDTLEESLGRLKEDYLIDVSKEGDSAVIVPQNHVLTPAQNGADEEHVIERIRDRLPF